MAFRKKKAKETEPVKEEEVKVAEEVTEAEVEPTDDEEFIEAVGDTDVVIEEVEEEVE